MNKKVALITLIEASMVLTPEEKLDLIDGVPGLNEFQVDALGKFLAIERQTLLDNELYIMEDVRRKLSNDNTVYVGVGKPNISVTSG